MMPVENTFDKGLAVMRDIPRLPDRSRRIEIPLHMHKPGLIQLHLLPSKLGFEQFGVADHQRHPPDDRLVRPEKIQEGDRKNKTEARQESQTEQDDRRSRQEFLVYAELDHLDEIEEEKDRRQQNIVDAILQKGIGRGRQEAEMPAEKDKGGDIPAHHKDPRRHPNKSRADRGSHFPGIPGIGKKRGGARSFA